MMVRPRLHVLAVGDGTAFAGVGLYHHVVPGFPQGANAARHQPDPRFVVFYLFRNSDNHELLLA